MSHPDRITFYFDEVRRSISVEEALILSDWLHKTRTLAAGPLAERIDSEIETQDAREGIELDVDARHVLRELFTDADLGEHAELKNLAQALQGEIWNELTEDA
jgi:hypothetical protein